ncbi:AfsR/SARP family transcriptional regulator [Modestobacter muralis]|uniref:AfsR/SARP family transcriptional regulator n=1 Tax=Modestobacter muralis TaxID=1608614 RepID=A0A6P0EP19_9ACTN|nr:AfsR/SARP family transcriptional regulator [Modestobacter muralis]
MPLSVCLLGPVVVRDAGGRAVDVGGPRARALLARLALEPGRVVGLDTLVEAVWDADPPAAPGNALQALVSRLRRAAPELSLRAQAHGYLLDLPADAVDAGRFEALAARARGAADPAQVVALLTEAEGLWRGPALADLRDLVFSAAPAARLDELRLTAAEQRLAAGLTLGDPAGVLAELEQLVTEHPLREPLCVLQVRALRLLGRPADALAAYDRCRARLADELGLDPSPALQAEQLAVLRGQAAEPVPARGGTPLRSALTSFLGRDAELTGVQRLLDAGRLVTLLGPGGAGKTRLALESAHHRRAAVPDGVWWVELAPVADARLLPAAVLAAVGQREGTSLERVPTLADAGDRLRETFAERRALLVLDNCEHLVAAVAELTDTLLAHCPALSVLTTSREPLGVPGEAVLPVGPLEVPDAGAEGAAGTPVVRLFADRAAAVRPGFTVTAANLDAVLDVCTRLDGMPLALELAAARLRSLSVQQIADRLDDRFSLLTGGSRVALPRHQTLRAVVEWSWEALDERERAVARRLSVFSGGAALDAAEVVCADPGWPAGAVLDAVTGLVEKSMLLAAEGSDGSVRYRMLETIRAYGGEQLDAAGERDTVEAAQTAWCLRLVDELEPRLRRADQLGALHRLRAEHDGLVAVLQRLVTARDGDAAVHLAGRLTWYWFLSGMQVAGARWLSQVVTLPGGPPPLRTACLAFGAMLQLDGGDWVQALTALQAVADLPDEDTWASGDVTAAVSWAMAVMFTGRDRTDGALSRLETHPDPWVVAMAHGVRAQVAENDGEPETLAADLQLARAEFTRLGDRWGRSITAAALAQLRATDGDLAAAVAAYEETIELSEALGTHEDTPMMRVRLALVRAAGGEEERAGRDLAELRAELEGDGGMLLSFAEGGLAELALLGGRLAEAERWYRSALARLATVTTGPPQIRSSVQSGLVTVLALQVAAGADPALLTEAAEQLTDAVDLAVRMAADMPVAAITLQAAAALALAEGDPGRAATLLGRATAVRGRRDLAGLPGLVVERAVRAALGAEELERRHAAGAATSRADVFADLGVTYTGGWPGAMFTGGEAQTRRR